MFVRCLMVFAALLGGASSAAADGSQSAHDFSFTAIEGGSLPLSQYEGKVVLVVNTASRCGFTRQYDDLQAVWDRYRDQGLVVLGVPSNDFGGQEPGTEAEIKEFCEVNFSIDFPMTTKEHVKGKAAHPFYAWAAGELGSMAKPMWNFHKYLIDGDGRLVDWFSSPTAPTSDRMTRAIEEQLARLETIEG